MSQEEIFTGLLARLDSMKRLAAVLGNDARLNNAVREIDEVVALFRLCRRYEVENSCGFFSLMPREITVMIMQELDIAAVTRLMITCRGLNEFRNKPEVYRVAKPAELLVDVNVARKLSMTLQEGGPFDERVSALYALASPHGKDLHWCVAAASRENAKNGPCYKHGACGIYYGDVKNQSRKGFGIDTGHYGGTYIGPFLDNKTHGEGWLFGYDCEYKGGFLKGEKCGKAIIDDGGDLIQTMFYNGKPCGGGCIDYADGDRYVGLLDKVRLPCTYGVFSRKTENRKTICRGQIEKGELHGEVVYEVYMRDGDKWALDYTFIGIFKKGGPCEGVYRCGGVIYWGYFDHKTGLRNGFGDLQDKHGLRKVEYNNGKKTMDELDPGSIGTSERAICMKEEVSDPEPQDEAQQDRAGYLNDCEESPEFELSDGSLAEMMEEEAQHLAKILQDRKSAQPQGMKVTKTRTQLRKESHENMLITFAEYWEKKLSSSGEMETDDCKGKKRKRDQ
jgi:hypothetical protein